MNILTTTTGSKLAPEPNSLNKKKSSHQYEDKIHLEEAKEMKPNTFFREDNQSPIPQDDQRYTLAPPEYAPTSFDPYKYVGLNKRKANSKAYQIMLDGDFKKKTKTSKKSTI